MSRRWLALWGLLIVACLAGCELATPPPVDTPTVGVTEVPVLPTETPVAWPSEPLVFAHLEKIWIAEGAAPYALTLGRAPTLSPDGQQVAYLLPDPEEEELSQVYVLDLRSGQIFLVSGPPAAYSRPTWSPDSQSVAYVNGAVVVVSDARGEVQRVVATDAGVADGGTIPIAWTHDGGQIVCPLTRLGVPELFALSVADGQAVQLSHTGGYLSTSPFVVLPEDTSLGLRDTVLYTNHADGGTLWLVGIDGTGRRRVLPRLSGVVAQMVLSPRGQRLAGLRQGSGEPAYALWAVDLTTDKLYEGGTLDRPPDLLRWGEGGQVLYWVSEAQIYRYTLASGKGEAIAQLPDPTPPPTATPLPVVHRVLYFYKRTFYQAEPYAEAEPLKDLSASLVVSSGYTLHDGTVAFPREADLYRLLLEGGVPRRLYTFQEEGLVGVEVVWSLQGNALLYAATYEEEEATLGFRVDLGILQVDPIKLHRFASLTDRTGATPLFYDEDSGEAIMLPRGGDPSFLSLEVYGVEEGQIQRILPVGGEGTAAVSPDRAWAVATGYDNEAGHGFLRTYRLTGTATLTPGQSISQTFPLPEGTYTWGPLRWSPDGQYVAFIPIRGDPWGEGGEVEAIWVLQVETLEARPVVAIDDADVYLVGWR